MTTLNNRLNQHAQAILEKENLIQELMERLEQERRELSNMQAYNQALHSTDKAIDTAVEMVGKAWRMLYSICPDQEQTFMAALEHIRRDAQIAVSNDADYYKSELLPEGSDNFDEEPTPEPSPEPPALSNGHANGNGNGNGNGHANGNGRVPNLSGNQVVIEGKKVTFDPLAIPESEDSYSPKLVAEQIGKEQISYQILKKLASSLGIKARARVDIEAALLEKGATIRDLKKVAPEIEVLEIPAEDDILF